MLSKQTDLKLLSNMKIERINFLGSIGEKYNTSCWSEHTSHLSNDPPVQRSLCSFYAHLASPGQIADHTIYSGCGEWKRLRIPEVKTDLDSRSSDIDLSRCESLWAVISPAGDCPL